METPAIDTQGEAKAAPRLLLAGDDPDMRVFLATRLAVSGFAVEEAHGADAAIERISRGRPADVALLDFSYLCLEGLQVLRCLKEEAPWERVPVVALAEDEKELALLAKRAASVDACLVKPVSLAELEGTLARLAASRVGKEGT